MIDQWLTTRRGTRDIFPEQRISNGRLAMAAQETALDKYILTKSFIGKKWKQPLTSLAHANSFGQGQAGKGTEKG